jgi:hypothetical protein
VPKSVATLTIRVISEQVPRPHLERRTCLMLRQKGRLCLPVRRRTVQPVESFAGFGLIRMQL